MKLATLRSSSATSRRIAASRLALPIGVGAGRAGPGLGVSGVTFWARRRSTGPPQTERPRDRSVGYLLLELGDRGGDGLAVHVGVCHADVVAGLQRAERGRGLLAGAEGHVLGLAAHGVLHDERLGGRVDGD